MAISFFKRVKVAKTVQLSKPPAGIQTGFAGLSYPLRDLSVKQGCPKLRYHYDTVCRIHTTICRKG